MNVHTSIVGLAFFHDRYVRPTTLTLLADPKEVTLVTYVRVVRDGVKGVIVGRVRHGEQCSTRAPGLYCHGDNDGYYQS